jgi:hypothetical protein
MAKQITLLDTVDAVIDTLGGTEQVRKITRYNETSAVPMWKNRGKFPAKTFKVMQDALRERGFTAPPELWGMV